MVQCNNIFDNPNMKLIEEGGCYRVYEHQKDMSAPAQYASQMYFMQEMNIRKRQVLCALDGTAVKVQAGSMQWVAGNLEISSGVTGVGNLFGKMVKGAVTGESAVKPIYSGSGCLMLEPTYRYLLIENVGEWGEGMTLDDGLFLACDSTIQEKIVSRTNASSALLGGEGLFNLSLSGNGYCVLESPVPREELIEFVLDRDVLKIDGNMAIAWSSNLQFTVEKSTKSLLGSGLSGEGFVNVFRGSGRVLMAPTIPLTTRPNPHGPEQKAATSSQGLAQSVLNSVLDL